MRILVTGGSGRLGRHCLRELASAKHELLSVDRNFMPPGEPRICRTLIADVGDAGQVYDAVGQFKPEAVVHLASNPNPVNFSRQDIFMTNVRCCYNVLQAAGDFGVRRVVQASSIMACGYVNSGVLPKRVPLTEDDFIPSANAYAMSKRVSETICDSMAVRYPTMPIVSLRPTHVITPDQYGELQRRRERQSEQGGGQLWSYIDARDVAIAFRVAVEASTEGHQVFQIAAKDHALDMPLATAAEKYLNLKLEMPAGMDPFASPIDCSKILKLLGWSPKYSWRDQVRDQSLA